MGDDGALTVAAVETAPDAPQADILITARRAAALKLANQRDAASADAVRLAPAPWRDAGALADPAGDLAHPLQGPFRAVPLAAPEAARAALALCRRAGLLPAAYVLPDKPAEAEVSAAAVADAPAPTAPVLTRARLPMAGLAEAHIVAFGGDAREHVALVIGRPHAKDLRRPPLVRLHSECLTGDVLASLKCDCGPQLHEAIRRIAADGWGLLLYLRQEGRGIGLTNKLRAYAFQDQGLDTVDANWRLGFDDDERDFRVAGAMLASLGQTRVRLLTNNPRKAADLEAMGVAIEAIEPLRAGEGPENTAYLATKRKRSGHT